MTIIDLDILTLISIIDATPLTDVGRALAYADNTTPERQYLYLKGVASTVAGSWVTYDSSGNTALLAANAVGNVAIAMAAINTTGKYGWYQVKGAYATAKSDTTAANKALYIDTTSGQVDDAIVSGDLVLNAFSTASDTAGALPVYINYPMVTDVLG